MKNTFFALLIILSTLTIQAQVVNLEAEGNLESLNPIGCLNLNQVSNSNNPADIYIGMSECIKNGKYENAAKLFAIAGAYATYDMKRVKDKSAHQAMIVLQMNTLGEINEDIKELLLQEIEKIQNDTELLSQLCSEIRAIGMPTYYPKYMIQHGMGAFSDNQGDGLVEDFNETEAWEKALGTYLHCTD